MFGVGHGIPNSIFQENLEHSPGFFVHEPADALDTTSSAQPPDCRFGDALDVVSGDFPMAFGTAFA